MKHFYNEITKHIENMILINDIPNIDDEFWDHIMYNNEYWQEIPEIYQYFATDCTDYDVKRIQKLYPETIFTYSPLIDCFVLLVPHWGTSWDVVETTYNGDEK